MAWCLVRQRGNFIFCKLRGKATQRANNTQWINTIYLYTFKACTPETDFGA